MEGMIRAMADSEIRKALCSVLERVAVASKARPKNLQHFQPRLVAVTKIKPVAAVKEAYLGGQRHFGENYVQELEEKAKDCEILKKCQDIKWHFIGHLQRNKVNKVLSVPNIWMIETIDNKKMASVVNNAWERQVTGEPLNIMVQVNTSREEQKNGCKPEDASDMVKFVMDSCPHLKFCGIMTIGAFDHDLSKGPNPDFQTLIECRTTVCETLGLDIQEVELSMGMSNDFEHAIAVGSSNVRVGSTIFGAREYKSLTAKAEAEKQSNNFNSQNEASTSQESRADNSSTDVVQSEQDSSQDMPSAQMNGLHIDSMDSKDPKKS